MPQGVPRHPRVSRGLFGQKWFFLMHFTIVVIDSDEAQATGLAGKCNIDIVYKLHGMYQISKAYDSQKR